MKKYLFAILAIICTLSSCTNEDQIDIKYETTFKLMPSSVISGFKEFVTGSFDLNGDFKVRTSLFIYDKTGTLIDKQISYLDKYTDVMTVTTSLPLGEYTSVATTDIVEYANSTVSTEMWQYKNPEVLNTFNIIDAGYMGQDYKILGVSTNSFTVKRKDEIVIPIYPAGCLFTIYYIGIHNTKFSNVIKMGLYFNRSNDYLYFTENATPETKITSRGSYDFKCSELDLTNSYYDNTNNIYGYSFHLPDPAFNFLFSFTYTDGSKRNLDPETIKMEAGQQYLITLDLDKSGYGYELTNGTKSTPSTYNKSGGTARQLLHVKDLVKKIK
nr:hypothetical protein [uncultured Macellibacteroides sp.]